MCLKVTPIDFYQDGKPRDPALFGAVQEFAKDQFGSELVFPCYAKVWATTIRDDDKVLRVIGLVGTRAAVDICLFHVIPPTADKEGLRIAERGRDLMYVRIHDYLEDLGHTGNTVLCFVAETAERYWRRFLLKIGARPAHRYEIEVR